MITEQVSKNRELNEELATKVLFLKEFIISTKLSNNLKLKSYSEVIAIIANIFFELKEDIPKTNNNIKLMSYFEKYYSSWSKNMNDYFILIEYQIGASSFVEIVPYIEKSKRITELQTRSQKKIHISCEYTVPNPKLLIMFSELLYDTAKEIGLIKISRKLVVPAHFEVE
ncbi:hypothetical protein M2325_000692 [Methanococcus voltae PS]|uniref:Uncharacterized protein n=1 Tax=Methanococcus voltae PS TaxID=523842 RepID=A0ABT2EVL6_METVO|nr:hypothetical protein [Methanococcus voltae]MCS3922007.1 hypothetical protein [Methanococcus voltae PS]